MGTKATYKGQPVEITRPARQGDKDFKPAGGDQVLIKLKDGSETAVPKAEVTETD